MQEYRLKVCLSVWRVSPLPSSCETRAQRKSEEVRARTGNGENGKQKEGREREGEMSTEPTLKGLGWKAEW